MQEPHDAARAAVPGRPRATLLLLGFLLVGVGAVVVLAALFLPWYAFAAIDGNEPGGSGARLLIWVLLGVLVVLVVLVAVRVRDPWAVGNLLVVRLLPVSAAAGLVVVILWQLNWATPAWPVQRGGALAFGAAAGAFAGWLLAALVPPWRPDRHRPYRSPWRAAGGKGWLAASVALVVVAAAQIPWVSSRTGTVSSPLDSDSALQCRHAVRSCTAPGSIRWSLPLSGPYNSYDAAPRGSENRYDDSHALNDAVVTFDDRTMVYQQGRLVEAVDPVTGTLRWRTTLASAERFVTSSRSAPPVVADGTIAVQACTGPPDRMRVWTLDAHDGHASRGIVSAGDCGDDHQILAASRSGVVVADEPPVTPSRVRSLDRRSGTVRWTVPLPRHLAVGLPADGAVIGHVLYATTRHGIYRLDLRTGTELPALRLDPRLPRNGIVSGRGAGLGALLYTGVDAMARLDPNTGKALWIQHYDKQTNSDGGGDVVRVDNGSHSVIYDAAIPRPQGDDYQMRVVDIATGRTTLTAPGHTLMRHEAHDRTDMYASPLYAGTFVVPGPPNPPADAPVGLTRVEGLDPRTRRPIWVGPWAGDDSQTLPGPSIGPHVMIVQSCAPTGERGTACTKERLYALNT